MKKLEKLFNQVESFEKLAMYGDRRSFLRALAQSEYMPSDQPSHENMVNALQKAFIASRTPGSPVVGPEMEVSDLLTKLQFTKPNNTQVIKEILGTLAANANAPLNAKAREYLNVLNYAAPTAAKPTPAAPGYVAPKASSNQTVNQTKKELASAIKLVNTMRKARSTESFMDLYTKTYDSLKARKVDIIREYGDINTNLAMSNNSGSPLHLSQDKVTDLKTQLEELDKTKENIDKVLAALENSKKSDREF